MALLLFSLSIALTVTAPAATTVSLERDGVPIAQGEICRFAAEDRENPFRRWLSSQDLTCVAAGSQMTFPPGRWNVFGRVKGMAVSSAPLLIGDAGPPETLALSLRAAATIAPLLRPGQSAVVYAPRSGSAFPIDTSAEPATVPAGEALWLFVMEKRVPVAVIPLAALDATSRQEIDARNGGPSCIIGWLQVTEADRAAIINMRGLSPPRVRATSIGPAHDSDPLPPLAILNGAFVRLRDVPAGDVDLDVSDRSWLSYHTRVNVSTAVTIVPDPLLVRAAGAIALDWSARQDLLALDRSIDSCDRKESPLQLEISLASCPDSDQPYEPVDPEKCHAVKHETYAPEIKMASITVENLAPGNYRAELRFGKLPPSASMVRAVPFQLRHVSLSAFYDTIYGGLSRGGEPFLEDASIQLPEGVGFASRKTGEYRAVLLHQLDTDAQINVAACDGDPHVLVLSDRPAVPNARFDIDIPDNELTISVTDGFTRESITAANVRYTVLSRTRRPLFTRTLTTGEGGTPGRRNQASAGTLVLTAVPEREIRMTVSAPGYQKRDVAPFSITKSERKSVEVQLIPLRGNRGRIVSPRSFDSGTVSWSSSTGQENERADIASDGTFFYNRPHGSEETMAVVSFSHPLWVSHAPAAERGQTLEIRYPEVPVRSFEVSVAPAEHRDARYVGVVAGAVRIPEGALREHQQLRRLGSFVTGTTTLLLRELAETGPIEIVLGPKVTDVPRNLRGIDVLALPQYAGAPRQRVGPGATKIVFEVK